MDYETIFVNKSPAPYTVTERGKKLIDVPPEGESKIEMFSPKVSWARWSKVVIGKDGAVESLTENTAWASPFALLEDFFMTEFFNEHGSPGGQGVRLFGLNPILRTGTPYLLVPRGVPQLVPIAIDDPEWIKYNRVHWKQRIKKIPIPNTGYHTETLEVFCEKTLRPQSELIKIYSRRAAINAAAFAREQLKKLPELELTEEALKENGS